MLAHAPVEPDQGVAHLGRRHARHQHHLIGGEFAEETQRLRQPGGVVLGMLEDGIGAIAEVRSDQQRKPSGVGFGASGARAAHEDRDDGEGDGGGGDPGVRGRRHVPCRCSRCSSRRRHGFTFSIQKVSW